MPIEPVKIPQNVYIEDRIVGPLTLRQIIISMLGIGFSYAIWASIAKVMGYVPWHITVIVWIPAALAVIFAFVRVNDLSMTHLLLLIVERINKPQTRVYGPRRGLTVNARSFTPPKQNSQKISANAPQTDSDIDTLSALMDDEAVQSQDDNSAEQTSDVPTQTTMENDQGASLPRRPVIKDRVKVSPLLQADLTELEDTSGRQVFHDILHPPASHA